MALRRGRRGTAPANLPRHSERLSPSHEKTDQTVNAGASLLDGMRLIAWKLQVGARHTADLLGGSRLQSARGERWARRWGQGAGDDPAALARWLGRAGGGRLWLPLGGAENWAAEGCTEADLAIADAAVAGVFDLLGSGPRSLGERPRWREDLYSGAEWPLTPSSKLSIVRGDGSDIRTVWELSRCYHFLPLARAWWRSGRGEYRDAFIRHAQSWMDQNPLGRGPHWASPMDAAIRAANWVVALVLFAEAEGVPADLWRQMLANLYATGLFLESHLEWHPVYRGNHFVSNGVGLVYLGVLFRGTRAGDRWFRRGSRIVTEEIFTQVGDDGVSFESSLAYHRLDTEFFAFAGELMRLNDPEGVPPGYEARLRSMYRFIATYLPESGEAPMLGDADDGRLHLVSAESLREPRRHRLGLPEGYWPEQSPASGAFPEGGFYVLRRGADHAAIRCGAVGLRGAGSHDHNDQLSFELVVAGRRVVADSGTYAYTRDLEARHAFRSTRSHSVVQVGGEEQNPIDPARPWRVLRDRTAAECLEWGDGAEALRFVGQHYGYTHRPSRAVCRRRISYAADRCAWEIEDVVSGDGLEAVAWRIHLAAGEVRRLGRFGSAHHFLFPGSPAVRIKVEVPSGLEPRIDSSEASDAYGTRYTRPCLVAIGEVQLPFTVLTTFSIEE